MSILVIKKKSAPVLAAIQATLLDHNILTTLQILLASCFIGICAQIKIPLYFTPVPLTLQTSSVLLVGAFLGSRKGTLAVLLYLLQGIFYLPVWAGGAQTGFAQLMGPTGGYLIAFLAQTYVTGWFLEKQTHHTLTKTVGILLFSTFMNLSLGSLWLAQFVGFKHCFILGFYPFIIGDMIKAIFIGLYVNSKR